MKDMGDILENAAIETWARAFSRSPRQVNALHEADAELIELPGSPDSCLAITVDTVAEEIEAGLYRDPYTIGWVTVMGALSDLAAVGAEPVGVVVSTSVPRAHGASFVERAARGIEDACRSLGTHVLGGDTNESPSVSVTGCAVGLVPTRAAITRRGAEPGDALFLTGRAGAGNALGLVRLAGLPDALFPEERYRPVARLSAGRALRGVASAAMDTSDGVLTTLDQLMRLNGLGFDVTLGLREALSEEAVVLCDRTDTPPWMLLAGPHGEFELAFTVPGSRAEAFASASRTWDPPPIRLGMVTAETTITIELGPGERARIDMAPVRNLAQTAAGDPDRYLSELRKLGRRWNLE